MKEDREIEIERNLICQQCPVADECEGWEELKSKGEKCSLYLGLECMQNLE